MTATFYKGGLRIKEQHEIILDVFRIPKSEPFLDGSRKMFYVKAMFLVLFLMGMKFLFGVFLPSAINIIALVIGAPLIVLLAIHVLEKFNEQVKQTGILALPQYYLIILGLMALSGVSYVFFS
ncbi:MAG: hypothetical protein Q7R76_00955 [Candidatus Woesearchaeota archaeon]|nr:hypothetical protein [Candidatus Woesearchaeota archaeon]